MLACIIRGGQIGVDQAGLRAAGPTLSELENGPASHSDRLE